MLGDCFVVVRLIFVGIIDGEREMAFVDHILQNIRFEVL